MRARGGRDDVAASAREAVAAVQGRDAAGCASSASARTTRRGVDVQRVSGTLRPPLAARLRRARNGSHGYDDRTPRHLHTSASEAERRARLRARAQLPIRGTKPLEELFPERFPLSLSASAFRQKAAVAAGSPTDSTWAGPLTAVRPSQTEFVGLVRAAALLGRIPGLRRAPFNTSVPVVTTGGTYGWVGAGKPKPVGELDLATVQLLFAKACGILMTTEELMRLGSPVAEMLLRDELVRGAAGFLDAQFIDPTVVAVANVNPASVTSAATPIVSSGTQRGECEHGHPRLDPRVHRRESRRGDCGIVLSPGNAMALAVTGNYKELRMHGGFIAGVPAVTTAAAGTTIACSIRARFSSRWTTSRSTPRRTRAWRWKSR